LNCSCSGGKLFIDPLLGPGYELLPTGGNQFRQADETLPSHIFVTSDDNENLMQLGQSTWKKISPLIAYGRVIAIGYAALMLVSSILFALVWILRKGLGRMKQVRYLRVRVVPAVGASVFVLMIFLMISSVGDLDKIATFSVWSVGIWLSSLLFPIVTGLSLYGVVTSFKLRRDVGITVWHHSLHSVIALLILVIFLASYGNIGFQPWSY